MGFTDVDEDVLDVADGLFLVGCDALQSDFVYLVYGNGFVLRSVGEVDVFCCEEGQEES